MAFAKRSRLRKPRLRTFTGLDPAVDAFRRSVAGAQDDGVDDSPEMLPDHPGDLQNRLRTAVRCRLQPPVPSGQRPGSAPVVPEGCGRFLPGLGGPPGCPHGASRTPAFRRGSSSWGPSATAHLVPNRIPLPSFTSARCSARRTLSTASPRCLATWNRSNAIFITASGIIARVAEM